jgi:putative glutamine amidotransferase
VHRVDVWLGSRLGALVRRRSVDVNSFHHQAPATVGRGLRVSGRSPDGVIEAIEDPHARFHVGVQWHAECLVDRREHLALFEGLVRAAGGRALRAA